MVLWEDVIQFTLCTVSVALCIWAQCHLLGHRKFLQQRLFWTQLMTLTSIDILFSICCLLFRALTVAQVHGVCRPLISLIMFLEFESCILEVHIAFGFMMACFTSRRRIFGCLYYSIVITFGLAGALTLLTISDMKFVDDPRTGECYPLNTLQWGVVEMCCCVVAVAFYSIGCCRMANRPSKLRYDALARGFWYLFNFLLTIAPHSTLNLTFPHGGVDILYYITLLCMSLNGAVNAGLYMFWILRSERSETRVVAGTVGTAFDEPRATLDAYEQFWMDSYFDIYRSGRAALAQQRDGTMLPLSKDY